MNSHELDKIKRRVRKEKKERLKTGKRIFVSFRFNPRKGYDLLASYYINESRYWILKFTDRHSSKERYLLTRYATDEELKYMYDVCGYDYNLIDIALGNNMRDCINAMKKDSVNKLKIEYLFDFDNYSKMYEDMKNMHKEMEENKDE